MDKHFFWVLFDSYSHITPLGEDERPGEPYSDFLQTQQQLIKTLNRFWTNSGATTYK